MPNEPRVSSVRREELFASLPPPWPETDLLARIRGSTIASGRKVVVLDDDPTGTQTVHDVPVLTEWTPQALARAWEDVDTTFYVLTNSRCYPLARAAALNREIARNLAQVARERGVEPVVVSRSDSTLRGHYPGEVAALVQTLEAALGLCYDGEVLVPFFLEGGRFTIDDVHWVQEGEWLTPAAKTEFARDPTFGYRHSDLRAWLAEKSRGGVPADAVMSISLKEIRCGGPEAVTNKLLQAAERRAIVVNAATYRDVEVLVWGLMRAESQGKRFLFRTAASFVRVRGGIPERGLLSYEELQPAGLEGETGGLTIVGSYVQRTTDQLQQALALDTVLGVELRVGRALDVAGREGEIQRALDRVERGLRQGRDVVLYTSRELLLPAGMPQLQVAQQVSGSLVQVLQRLAVRPAYLIGKGGITCSDLATEALGVRQAQALGQILPGVPVWRLGPESKYPGLPYVVFPGNVGGPDGVARAMCALRGRSV